MKFREAQQSDAEKIALLHANSWRQTYRGMMPDEFLDGDVILNRLQVWRDRLAHDRADQFVCLAEEGTTLLGFICTFGNEDSVWGSYIDNLHVAHERKCTGIGTALVKQTADWLETHYPQPGVYLWVMEANGPARRFYERLGAANVGTVDKSDLAGGSTPNCRYVWSSPRKLANARANIACARDRPSQEWVRIGKNMPQPVGDIGFPMVVHPRDADTAWVFPMDGTMVWPRTSPDGKPAIYATRDGGETWQRFDAGLPQAQAWWTVKRQAMTADSRDPVGLYFGTTSGELWMSDNEGEKWTCIAQHLPEIYAVEATELA